MKKLISIFAVLLCLSLSSAFAQVSVTSVKTKNVAALVQEYLIGPNIILVNDTAHKATFQLQETVTSNQLGIFNNKIKNTCDMPMDTGLVITTCDVAQAKSGGYGGSCSPVFSVANMPDSVFYWTYTKFCLENGLTIMTVNDVGYLSFWIKPVIDNFQFSYCFASEEYPTYVGADYNDFFGFFFSGPYDEYGNYKEGSAAYKMQNLALVPGTQTPVMINTVNHAGGYTSIQSNPEYHIVPTGNCTQSCGFKQWTVKLPTATTVVIANAYYKIDVAVCNISDHALQSGLFISKDMRRFDTINIDTTICENVDYYVPGFNEPLTEEGFYQYVFENETGGDSLINVELHINPTKLNNMCWELKEGDNLNFDYINIAAPGTYKIQYQTWLGCDSTVVYNVEWGEETMEVECVGGDDSGLNDANEDMIKIYPNPAKDMLFVEGLEWNSDVRIFDAFGRIVKEEKLQSNQIDISSLPTGTYIVNITTGDNSVSRKLSVQK